MKFKKAKIEFSKKRKAAEQSRNCEILENSWLKTVDEEGKSVFYPPQIIESVLELE